MGFYLLIRARRAVCPATGLDGPANIAVRDGICVAVGRDVTGDAARTIEVADGVLLPGLIDLHVHAGTTISVFGVNADEHMLRRGVTTALSQGDAGADNW